MTLSTTLHIVLANVSIVGLSIVLTGSIMIGSFNGEFCAALLAAITAECAAAGPEVLESEPCDEIEPCDEVVPEVLDSEPCDWFDPEVRGSEPWDDVD